MTVLLDVNVLIALLDPDHVAHDRAHYWFQSLAAKDWATCPIVENGVMRIMGARSYTDPPIGCAAVSEVLHGWCTRTGHHFWADSISMATSDLFDRSKLLTAAQITDAYLLALAVANGGRLATFNRRMSAAAVKGGREALEVIA